MMTAHVRAILRQLRTEHIPGLLRQFLEKVINGEFGLKKGARENYLNLLISDLMSKEPDQAKFDAFMKLLFEDFIDENKLKAEMTQLTIQTIVTNFQALKGLGQD